MASLGRREFLFASAAGAATLAGGRVGGAAAAPPESMFRTASGWNLPAVVIDQPAAGTAPGLLFAAPFATSAPAARGSSGPVIFDEDGNPMWFLPLDNVRAMNFKTQTYRGAPALTWYESSGGALYGGSCVIYGHDYRELKRVHGGHKYAVDLHEFTLTSRNTALLAIANEVPADGSRVVEGIVQEVDIDSGKVLFEWHSLDHVPLDDSYRTRVGEDGTVDYFHLRVPRIGFETAIRSSANSGYIAVAALDASRSELASTRPIPLQH